MKLGSLTFKDNYGKTYPFGVYSKNTRFKAVAAIYAFLTSDNRVLYIGQTTDLSTRFNDHHKWNAASRLGFEKIAVCTQVTLLMLDVVERRLIEHYRPRCNELLRP